MIPQCPLSTARCHDLGCPRKFRVNNGRKGCNQTVPTGHNGVPEGVRGRASRGVPATQRKKIVERPGHAAVQVARTGGAKWYDVGKLREACDRVGKESWPPWSRQRWWVAGAGADMAAQALMKWRFAKMSITVGAAMGGSTQRAWPWTGPWAQRARGKGRGCR